MKIIKSIPFNTSIKVVCGICKGEKQVYEQGILKNCKCCLGEGFLQRVTEGKMTLYTIKQSALNESN